MSWKMFTVYYHVIILENLSQLKYDRKIFQNFLVTKYLGRVVIERSMEL